MILIIKLAPLPPIEIDEGALIWTYSSFVDSILVQSHESIDCIFSDFQAKMRNNKYIFSGLILNYIRHLPKIIINNVL